MPRIRTIKPETPQSESLGRCSRDARLLFIFLWTQADDLGRLRAASRMLASVLFPFDDDAPSMIEGWLSELENEGCIRQYCIDGTHYLDIPKWLEHQKIDHPSKSKIPEFREEFAKPRETLANPRASRARGLDLGPGPKDQGPRTVTPLTSPRKRGETDTQEFLDFWEAYPHKVGRAAARTKFAIAIRKTDLPTIMAALARYKSTKPPDREWCHPTTWLNQERWADQPATMNGANGHDRRAAADPRAYSFSGPVPEHRAPKEPPPPLSGRTLRDDA